VLDRLVQVQRPAWSGGPCRGTVSRKPLTCQEAAWLQFGTGSCTFKEQRWAANTDHGHRHRHLRAKNQSRFTRGERRKSRSRKVEQEAVTLTHKESYQPGDVAQIPGPIPLAAEGR